jgi:hypothetical protein
LDNEGNKVVAKNVKTTLVQFCQSVDIPNAAKLRLLMVYLISQGGIQDATRKELMRSIHPKLQKAVLNLQQLGVDLKVAYTGGKSKHNKTRLQEFEKRNKEIPMALMRYIPFFHSVINDLVNYDLSEADYPFTQTPADSDRGSKAARPSTARSVRSHGWRGGGAKDKAGDEKEDTRPRLIVFVVGGITMSEIRSVYEIAQDTKANIYCGSSSTLTPRQFLQGLSGLSDKDFADHLASNSTDNAARPAAGAKPGHESDED